MHTRVFSRCGHDLLMLVPTFHQVKMEYEIMSSQTNLGLYDIWDKGKEKKINEKEK